MGRAPWWGRGFISRGHEGYCCLRSASSKALRNSWKWRPENIRQAKIQHQMLQLPKQTRKCDETYPSLGFTSITVGNEEEPQSVTCLKISAFYSMKPHNGTIRVVMLRKLSKGGRLQIIACQTSSLQVPLLVVFIHKLDYYFHAQTFTELILS